jgi:hypothetical protein
MFRNIQFVLMYHPHTLLDLIYITRLGTVQSDGRSAGQVNLCRERNTKIHCRVNKSPLLNFIRTESVDSIPQPHTLFLWSR